MGVPGREEMLERIRKALGRPPEEPTLSSPTFATPLPDLGAVMAPIPPEELLARFESELQKVAGCAYRAATVPELEEVLRAVLTRAQATAVIFSRNPLLAQLRLSEKLRTWGMTVAAWAEGPVSAWQTEGSEAYRNLSFSAAVGITGVDFALAETGSLVLTSLTEGSQLASLAPPVHVALYRRSQVLGSLEEVLEKIPVARDPNQPTPGRSVVFITGTSRTADIEQILIRGVHGPREVHAILVEESCLA